MANYTFDPEKKKILEESPIPYAIYQLRSKIIVTILVSDGFLTLFGMSREDAVEVLNHDMYRSTHPEDVARIADAAFHFASKGGDYDVVYRTKKPSSDDYRIVHALGKNICMEDGTRLEVVWYTDEGLYDQTSGRPELSESTPAISGGWDPLLNDAFHNLIQKENLIQDSYYNKLTGLPNMSYFLDLAEEFKHEMYNTGSAPLILYFDLNGMKTFNEKYGFASGNRLLCEVANVLKKHFSVENCGHFGSDHFVVCWEDCEDLEQTLYEIFDDIAAIDGGRTLPVRVGIYKDTFETTDATLACDRAKVACEQERDQYISKFAYFDQSIMDAWMRKAYVLDNLKRALSENWIKVYYQPITRSVSGLVCNEEALCRWLDPERGMLSPAEFIPILEDAGLLYKVDLRMVDLIIEDFEKRRKSGIRVVPVSVNLSWSDFQSCDMVQEICDRMDRYNEPHDLLNIEITETVTAKNPDYMKIQIQRFHDAGFQVWMDDFGSGYSSLDILQDFDFDLLKFNMEFMKNFETSPKKKVILTQLAQMAVKLGVDTLTEGVETKDQVRFLREIGCDKIQGFFFGRPHAFESVQKRYENNTAIEIENFSESQYYDVISKTGLHDPSVNQIMDSSRYNYFSSVPMGILEERGEKYYVLRYNKTFSDFLEKYMGQHLPDVVRQSMVPEIELSPHIRESFRKCIQTGEWEYVENMSERSFQLNAFIKKLTENPVTGATAIEIIILSMLKEY